MSALQHVLGHARIGLQRQADEVGRLVIIAHQEPRVDGDAVAAHAGAGLQDVHTRVLVGDANDLRHVHAADATDLSKLVGECDVNCAEGVLNDFGHLGGANVRHTDFALTEGCINLSNFLAHLGVVRANRTVVVK